MENDEISNKYEMQKIFVKCARAMNQINVLDRRILAIENLIQKALELNNKASKFVFKKELDTLNRVKIQYYLYIEFKLIEMDVMQYDMLNEGS